MTLSLDLPTLIVALVLVNVALCAALVLFWRMQKTYPGFGHWIVCQGAAVLAYLDLGLRGTLPELFTVVGISALMVAGAALRSRSLLLFFERPRSVAPDLVALVAVPLAVASFLYGVDSPVGRTLAAALGVAFVIGRAAAALAPGVRTQGKAAGVAIAFIVAFPAVLLLLVAAWAVSSSSRTIFAVAGANKAFFVFLLMYDVAITIFFLMLNERRLAGELVAAQGALERLAVTDALTGLPNRRKLEERLALEWKRERRGSRPIALLVLDIDHFKPYNDRHGHLEGDACLVRIAAAMRGVLREGADLLARLGGEEFVALLPESGPEKAAAVAERLRAEVESLAVPHGASDAAPVVTVSVGWASTVPLPDGPGPQDLLSRADAALYRAKHRGRNRVAADEVAAVRPS